MVDLGEKVPAGGDKTNKYKPGERLLRPPSDGQQVRTTPENRQPNHEGPPPKKKKVAMGKAAPARSRSAPAMKRAAAKKKSLDTQAGGSTADSKQDAANAMSKTEKNKKSSKTK